MCKKVSEERLLAQTTLNNVKGNNYSIADYKMCEKESVVVIKALERYLTEEDKKNE